MVGYKDCTSTSGSSGWPWWVYLLSYGIGLVEREPYHSCQAELMRWWVRGTSPNEGMKLNNAQFIVDIKAMVDGSALKIQE